MLAKRLGHSCIFRVSVTFTTRLSINGSVAMKIFARAVSDILIIISGGTPRLGLKGNSAFSDQLLWRLAHADHRIKRIIQLFVSIQYSFHMSGNVAALIRRGHPSTLLPRLYRQGACASNAQGLVALLNSSAQSTGLTPSNILEKTRDRLACES